MSNIEKDIRVRLAPSPTGALHVGTARSGIFNFLFARHMGGSFILRIEDTDLERSSKAFETDILDGLAWLGITSDEPVTRQTERTELYSKYLMQLVDNARAFYCPHTIEELDAERKQYMADKQPPRHHCDARDAGGKQGIIRLRNDIVDPVVFNDIIRGEISFDPRMLGDISLAKNISAPLYNFAVVIDDFDMRISHVIRGEDHIPNTPKQMLILRALQIDVPQYAHMPLLLGTDRSKLSKRHGATSVSDYRASGYLADAMFNYLALLGWNPGTDQEVFSQKELANQFTLERVQKAGAIFDIVKLDWMNGEYIRRRSPHMLRELAVPYFGELLNSNMPHVQNKDEYIERILMLEQPRLKKLSELPEKTDYFFKEPKYDASLLIWKTMSNEDVKNALARAQKIIQEIPQEQWNKEHIESVFFKEAENYQNRGELLWPLRVALSGKKASPGPFDILALLGRPVAVSRIQNATAML